MTELGYNYVDSFVVWEESLNDFEYTNEELYNQVCADNITTDKDKYENYKKFCSYFTKSMYYIANDSGFIHIPDNINEVCAYLNYYLNSELKKINDSRENLEQFYKKMKANNTSRSVDFTKCDDKIKKIEDNNLKDTQFLHNLFLNADKYIKNFSKPDNYKCTFANNCYSSYNEPLKKCYKSSLGTFCQKMEIFRLLYNNYMSNTSCKIPKSFPPFGEEPIAGIPSGHVENAAHSVESPSILPPKIGTLALTTPGIVIGLSVLYKFTPLGTRISQLFQRKNNLVQNIQEQNDDYTLFNNDNLHTSSSNSNYNITYHGS